MRDVKRGDPEAPSWRFTYAVELQKTEKKLQDLQEKYDNDVREGVHEHPPPFSFLCLTLQGSCHTKVSPIQQSPILPL